MLYCYIMKVEHLIAFCSVAKYKNITKAAKALKTSQPGLSRQLAALQQSVGELLYERTAFGIELTKHGEALLPHACAVAQTFQEAQNFLGENKNRRTVLNVGVSYHLAPSVTPRLLSILAEQRKNIDLIFYEDYSTALIDQLLHRQLDVCFVLQPESQLPQALEASITVYGNDAIGFFIHEDHLLYNEVYTSITALKGETIILTKSISAVYKNTLESIERNKVKPAKYVEVGSPSAVLSCVQQGIGIGIGLANYLPNITTNTGVKFVQLDEGGANIASLCIHHETATLDFAKLAAIDLIKNR